LHGRGLISRAHRWSKLFIFFQVFASFFVPWAFRMGHKE
jgi:hypothetical protein